MFATSLTTPLLHLAAVILGDFGESVPADRTERFLSLIKKEESLISAICFSFASDADDYEDLRQDALINLWRGIDSFCGNSSQRTWLYRVVFNSCVSSSRKSSFLKSRTVGIESLYGLIADEPSEQLERIALLHKLISKLNPLEKAIILMWLDEASYEDIAEVMGISKSNVAVRLHRIREKLSRIAPQFI